MFQMKGSAAEK